VYWLINAFAAFCADTLAGVVAQRFALNYIFVSSGIIGLFALVTLFLMMHVTSSFRNKAV
jgi:hypothetical protein